MAVRKKENIKYLILSLMAFALGTAILWFFLPKFFQEIYLPAEKPPSEEKPEAGFKAPDFTLKNLDHGKVRLLDYKGKAIYITFWVSWHPLCQDQILNLETFNKQKNKEVVFLTIVSGQKEEEIKSFLKRGRYNLPVLIDSDNIVAESYKVNALPLHIFINKDFKIQERITNILTTAQIQEKVLKLNK